jgi:hypothetical protein
VTTGTPAACENTWSFGECERAASVSAARPNALPMTASENTPSDPEIPKE